MRRAMTRLLSVTCVALAAGCAIPRAATGVPKPLTVSPVLKFDDVPVPARFTLRAEQSFAFQNEEVRVGMLRYAGPADSEQVIAFYREQMPVFQWTLVNAVEAAPAVLNFEKAGQSCIILVYRKGRRTELSVDLAPKSGRPRRLELH